MYNASSGPTAKLGLPKGAPVWQPLKPLKPVELQNAGFVQEKYLRGKSAHFSLWTVEEQLAAGKIAQEAEELTITDVVDKNHEDADSSEAVALSGMDAETLEQIKNEAYERGVLDGQKLQQEAVVQAAEQAQADSLAALADKANQLLVNIEQGVLALQENPAAWNEPLKRLALHLAEQLTLTELSISANAIQTIIDRCIETLDVQSAASVVVELNPNDMALLQNHKAAPGEKTHQWRLVADAHLLPGSVRVRADDAVVSDLIEHRLETLAHALLENPKPWQSQTAFQPERLAARRGKAETVEDALPRDASARFETAEPLDLSSLDLPDLDLPETSPKSDEDNAGPAHD